MINTDLDGGSQLFRPSAQQDLLYVQHRALTAILECTLGSGLSDRSDFMRSPWSGTCRCMYQRQCGLIEREGAMVILGITLVVLYLVFWAWHSPWAGKLTKREIDHYLSIIEKLPLPAEVKGHPARLRSWAKADDGKPVYM